MKRISSVALALALAGCAPRVQPGAFTPEYVRIGPLELSATIERDVGDLMGSVDIMNTSDRPVVVEYNGSCAVSIVLAAPGSESPRWDAYRWWQAFPDVCRPAPLRLEIPPETLARVLTPPVNQDQILGDSIPAGRHPVALRIQLLQPEDTTLLLSAGTVELEGSGQPLLAAGRGATLLPSP